MTLRPGRRRSIRTCCLPSWSGAAGTKITKRPPTQDASFRAAHGRAPQRPLGAYLSISGGRYGAAVGEQNMGKWAVAIPYVYWLTNRMLAAR
jgi:hypothetical protein